MGTAGRRRSWTNAALAVAVRESTSMAQTLRRLGLRPAGGNYELVKAKIQALGLVTAHWLGQAYLRGKTNSHARRRSLESILRSDVVYQSNKLRKRLLGEGVLNPVCSVCGGTSLQGGPIPLELDHIDGSTANNRLSNLRLICPNCHALTSNYRGKNTKYPQIPSIDEAKEGIRRCSSVAAYAREKNVSSATVRRWLLRAART